MRAWISTSKSVCTISFTTTGIGELLFFVIGFSAVARLRSHSRDSPGYIWPVIPWNPCASCLKKYLMTRWSL